MPGAARDTQMLAEVEVITTVVTVQGLLNSSKLIPPNPPQDADQVTGYRAEGKHVCAEPRILESCSTSPTTGNNSTGLPGGPVGVRIPVKGVRSSLKTVVIHHFIAQSHHLHSRERDMGVTSQC